MLPEHVCNLVATLSGPSCKTPLNWNLHMTSEGEEQFPFHQHVRSERAGEVFKPQDSSRSLRNLPTKLQLPTELQWRVMDFCADRATLWQLMHTSSGLRAEASKRFWADPHTYYLANRRRVARQYGQRHDLLNPCGEHRNRIWN
jgi:hypothetical protein